MHTLLSKGVSAAALMGIVLGGVFTALSVGSFSEEGQAVASAPSYRDVARTFITTDYQPQKAIQNYQKALHVNPADSDAHYELARTYMVTGNQAKVMPLVERGLASNPLNTRLLYVGGLSAGYTGDYTRAADLFNRYLAETKDTKWQSRLDLAWAKYQAGEYAAAKVAVDDAVQMFGANVWLNVSRGAIEHALGNTAAAQGALTEASAQLSALTRDEWDANYAFNGPGHFENGMRQVKSIIAYNEALVAGKKVVEAQKSDFSRFAGFAPEPGKGIVVSACGETCGPRTCTSPTNACGASTSWQINTCNTTIDPVWGRSGSQGCSVGSPPPVPERYGQSCTSINLCGIQATGTVQCDGRCSAIAPLPTAFGQGCTVTNRCGSARGTVGCNGQCNVLRFPTCTNPDDDSVTGGDDGWTDVTIDNLPPFEGQGYGNIGAKIGVFPNLVKPGQRAVIRWNSYEMASCSVTGSNGDGPWDGLQGERVTKQITLRATYTLTCTAFDGRVLTDKVVVGIVPIMCEIGQAGCEQ